MRVRWLLVGAVLVCGNVPQARGQVLQLPSYHMFGVSTTVVVPDRGSVMLGGMNRGATGQAGYGPWGNRAYGSASSASGLSVSATIHDFEAMDAALLAQAATMRVSPRMEAPRSTRLGDALTGSLSELRANRAAEPKKEPTAEQLLAQAERAERAGNIGAARVYRQMAARRLASPLPTSPRGKYSVASRARDE